MKKCRDHDVGGDSHVSREWFFRVEMLVVALLVGLPGLSADPRPRVTLSLDVKEATLQEVFQQITRRTGYGIVYSSNELKDAARVTLKVVDAELEEVLEACLKGTRLGFVVEDEVIVVTPRVVARARGPLVVTGKVVDAAGEPLAGCTVQVRGTVTGAVTDAEGRFRLSVGESARELSVSFIGMKSRLLPLSDRPASGEWVIVLEEDLMHLEDVIVTGYQNVSRHELTGSVTKLKAEEVMQGGKFSISQMLEGTVAGMSVTTGSGEPSATPKIRVRGTSSILGNKAPLWVLDGVILDDPSTVQSLEAVSNLDMNGDDAAYLIGNAIAGINPQDIESINVLKDAAAAAVYGVQAANGVIVITTKRGRVGVPLVSYHGTATLGLRGDYGSLYLMNAAERMNLSREIIEANLLYLRFPKGIGYEGLYFDYMNKGITRAEFAAAVKEMAKRNTDWYALLFRDALSHAHTVSLSGGNEHTTYYGSLGFANNQGTPRQSLSRRFTATAKVSSRPVERLFLNLQLNSSMTTNRGYHASVNPEQYAYTTARTLPAYDADGGYHFYEEYDGAISSRHGPYLKNILHETTQTGQRGRVSSVTVKADAQWEIWRGIRYEFNGSIVHSKTNTVSWATEFSNAVAMVRGYDHDEIEEGSEAEKASRLPYGGIYSNADAEQTSYTVQNRLGYSRRFGGDHVVSAQAISEIRSVESYGYSSTAYGWYETGQIIEPLITEENWDEYRDSGILRPTITDNTKNYVSWIGLASYSYKSKLIASFNIRSDGSNQFGENPRYRFLPVWSVGGKYILSGERFMQNSAVGYLALRASFGLQGNVDKNTSPDLVATIGHLNPDVHMRESRARYYPNPDLRWEKTRSYNAGLDLALWDGRLTGTFDAYRKITGDLIMNKEIAQVNGASTFKINGGEMTNTGIEANVTAAIVRTADWDVGLGVIYAYNKNKLTRANDIKEITLNDKIAGNALIVGETIGTLYSYHFAGLDHDTGLPIFYDSFGKDTYIARDGKVTPNYSLYEQEAGVVRSGVLEAPSTGSLQLSLRYKGLRLRGSLTYMLGGTRRLPNIYNYFGSKQRVYDPCSNVTKELNDRWKKPGDELHTTIPALYDVATYESISRRPSATKYLERPGTLLYDRSSARTASTDHLRMNSLSLNYLLPDRLTRAARLTSVSFSLESTNLFQIASKKWHGRDPLQADGANASLPRTFTFSTSITF
jgi:TonB-linked SusC/RagA family outer membrane protein